jgi:hypoxanthine phosphoribosyltransferase
MPDGGSVSDQRTLAATGGRELARTVFTREQIARRVEEMGRSITTFYRGRGDLVVLGLLKGSFIFVADLVRCISLPLQVDFLVASSYGLGTSSGGEVKTLYDPRSPLEGRHVVLVEDIVDSGATVNELVPALRRRGVATLELCALLHKHQAEKLALEPRWVGFDAPREFLVGYGLDHAEDFRHLPFVASIREGQA